jgi:twitching motility protein PilI
MDKIDLTDDPLTAGQVLATLYDLEQRFESAARDLPQFAADDATWDGLVFSVSGVRVVAPMTEVSEMLPMQERITRVPGAKAWVLGLANVRGSLLPVIDLQLFLGAKAVVATKSARILVIRQQGLVSGLLVPSVQGMRHFDVEDRQADARMKGALGAYVYEAFRLEGEIWPVMSMAALAADPAFRSAVIA